MNKTTKSREEQSILSECRRHYHKHIQTTRGSRDDHESLHIDKEALREITEVFPVVVCLVKFPFFLCFLSYRVSTSW